MTPSIWKKGETNATGNVVATAQPKEVGELLLSEGHITPMQRDIILTEQEMVGGRFGEVAQNLGFVNENKIARVLARQAGLPFVDLKETSVDPEIAQFLTAEDSEKLSVIPIRRLENGKVQVGMAEPNNLTHRDKIGTILANYGGAEIVGIEGGELFLTQARVYAEMNFREKLKELIMEAAKKETSQSRMNNGNDASYPHIANTIIWDALTCKASDVHLVFDGEIARLSYRINGTLTYIMSIPKPVYVRLGANIKTTSGLDAGDRLHKGDGSWNFRNKLRTVNIRLSKQPTVPIQEGESLVMRILDRNRISLDLDALGFFPEDSLRLKEISEKPHGLVLVTGPTGSGKTTTLYSLISLQDAFSKNILTIENPVEYKMPGFRQVQVNEKAGVTFAEALRTFLRQDPNIILVGEVRDVETAEMTLQASVTGHLVFSTMHTNSALGAVPRLIGFGTDLNVLRSVIEAVIAQRLVKKLCEKCRKERLPTDEEREIYVKAGMEPPEILYEAVGCQFCHNGFSGPTIIYEVAYFTQRSRDAISAIVPVKELERLAEEDGWVSMHKCALKKAAHGIITLQGALLLTQNTRD